VLLKRKLDRSCAKARLRRVSAMVIGRLSASDLMLYIHWLTGESDGIVLQQMPEPSALLLEKF
jgi:hypothetical protein